MSAVPMLADAPWLISGGTARVLQLLNADGEEARVVGGAVRNALLGLVPGDIDIATTALPHEVMRRAKSAGIKAVPTGIDHGTVTLVIDSQPYEVTTLREDTETFGRKAKVAFGRDWVKDAERRDFTMNGLSVDADGVVHDYVGGIADAAARRVRFIGDPDQRIAEDFLRILRFFRIHAAFGAGDPDRDGYLACIRGRAGLASLSAERLRMETLKLLVAGGASAAALAMADGGLLQALTGGVVYTGPLSAMIAIERELGLTASSTRRLAALTVAVTEDAKRVATRLNSPMRKPRRWIRWGIAGGAWPPRGKPMRGGCSTGSVRSAITIACCWAGREPAVTSARLDGVRSPSCRSAGLRRNFRFAPPTSSRAAWRKDPRSDMS